MIREIFFKTLCLAVAGVFFCETLLQPYSAYAQTLPSPSTFLQPLNQSFAPVMIRGMQINPQDGLSMNLIVDSGDEPLDETTFKSESEKLIKYFLTALTVPEEDLWVNLSPYEKDRLTSSALAQTAMGEELLAQDYILKQLTAALINPDGKTGKEFWNKIYEKAYEVFGTADVPVDSFNKIWIMPEKAEVFAQNDTVLILDSKLKVMMEEDYLAREQNVGAGSKPAQDQGRVVNPPLQNDIKSVMRDVVLPVITQEINNGQNFAPLRQIFHALILARWYKDNLKESILGQVYADQSKVKGIDQDNTASLQTIYNQYLDAFRSGAQGLIKEEYNPATQSLAVRKYVTGGFKAGPVNYAMLFDIKAAAAKFQKGLSGVLSFVGFKATPRYVPGRRFFLRRSAAYLTAVPSIALIAALMACVKDGNQRKTSAVGHEQEHPPIIKDILDIVHRYYSNVSKISEKVVLQGVEGEDVKKFMEDNTAVVENLLHLEEISIEENESLASYAVRLRKFLDEKYGYYFTLTIDFGETRVGGVSFKDLYQFQMRKILKKEDKTRFFGGQNLTWREYHVGTSLFERPAYLLNFVEQTLFDHIVLMLDNYRIEAEEIDKHYQALDKDRKRRDIDSALWFKQWRNFSASLTSSRLHNYF